MLLAEVAKILCKELTYFKGFQFDGCMHCIQVPARISAISPQDLFLYSYMLLNGVDLEDNDCIDSQIVLTVSQTILFNYDTNPTSFAIKFQCSTNREPPLPLFIGLKV